MNDNDNCICNINTKFGSWEQTVKLKAPKWSSKEYIWIDKCLVEEIEHLWDIGIITLGCCCGHKQTLPMINVEEQQYDKMIELGYTLLTNPHGKDRKDSFYPKTIIIEPQMVENHIRSYYNVGLLNYKK